MTNEADIATLNAKVAGLNDAVREVRQDVSGIMTKLGEIMDYISGERGAERARAQFTTQNNFRIDLTWTKVMALGAIIGACIGLPAFFHSFR
jgi:hypothetical protein